MSGPFGAALFVSVLAMPGAGHAVGFNDDDPPETSPTTTDCAEGTIWDADANACVEIDAAGGDQASLYGTARELAWAGRLDDARRVLDRMEDSDRVLTYRGFVARKAGDWADAVVHYEAALAVNPDNLLARSYYGQGLAARGDLTGARAQLREIRQRGGRVSWPELALRLSIGSGAPGY